MRCAAIAAGSCPRWFACAPAVASAMYGAPADCVTRQTNQCTAELQLVTTPLPAQQATDCIADLQNLSCPDVLTGVIPMSCRQAMGALPSGSGCVDGQHCESGICVIPTTNPGCGVCQGAAAAGDPCNPQFGCGPGLQCTPKADGTGDECTTYGAIGSSCDAFHRCDARFWCLGTAPHVTGVCVAPLNLGALCSNTNGQTPPCNKLAGLACNPRSGHCETVQIAAQGAQCGMVAGHLVLCAGGGFCAGAKMGVTQNLDLPGTCVPGLQIGDSCDPRVAPFCPPGSSCVNGSCRGKWSGLNCP